MLNYQLNLLLSDEISSVNSGLSSYTDCTLEDSLSKYLYVPAKLHHNIMIVH